MTFDLGSTYHWPFSTTLTVCRITLDQIYLSKLLLYLTLKSYERFVPFMFCQEVTDIPPNTKDVPFGVGFGVIGLDLIVNIV